MDTGRSEGLRMGDGTSGADKSGDTTKGSANGDQPSIITSAKRHTCKENISNLAGGKDAHREKMSLDNYQQAESELGCELFDALLFILSLPEKTTLPEIPLKLQRLPEYENKPVLVLDLDETLVHCKIGKWDDYDHYFELDVQNMHLGISVWWRPHLFYFLKKIQGKYETVLFTASQQVYAETLLNVIDADGHIFQHRLFRDSCRLVRNTFIKDLDILGRDLSKTIIVDNSAQSYAYHVQNGYPIPSWYDNQEDTALLDLLVFLEHELETRKEQTDIRNTIVNKFPLYKHITCNLEDVVESGCIFR